MQPTGPISDSEFLSLLEGSDITGEPLQNLLNLDRIRSVMIVAEAAERETVRQSREAAGEEDIRPFAGTSAAVQRVMDHMSGKNFGTAHEQTTVGADGSQINTTLAERILADITNKWQARIDEADSRTVLTKAVDVLKTAARKHESTAGLKPQTPAAELSEGAAGKSRSGEDITGRTLDERRAAWVIAEAEEALRGPRHQSTRRRIPGIRSWGVDSGNDDYPER